MKARLLKGILKAYIPKGPYCYKSVGTIKGATGIRGIKVKKCPFYCSIDIMGIKHNFCSYCASFNDILLDDQCKICGEKE